MINNSNFNSKVTDVQNILLFITCIFSLFYINYTLQYGPTSHT